MYPESEFIAVLVNHMTFSNNLLVTTCYFNRALARDVVQEVLPALDAEGIPLYFISIGTKERGLEFADRTGFPANRLLADPNAITYEVLGMKKGILETFFSIDTPLAIWEDIKSGRIATLKEVLKTWVKYPLWHPPKADQALQQGGAAVFCGKRLTWVHRDRSTGAHVDLSDLIRRAMQP